MILLFASLLLAHYFCGGEANAQTPNEKWMEMRMKELQKSIEVDWDNPPKGLVYQLKEQTCHDWWKPFCGQKTEFRMTHKLTKADGKGVKQEAPKYTIYPKIVSSHNSKVNHGKTSIFIGVEKAMTSIDIKSKGWSAGAQLSMPFGSTGASVALSGSYHEEETKGTTATSSEGIRWECLAGHSCEIQYWTMHLQVEGICDRIPSIKICDLELDACGRTEDSEDLRCDQYTSFAERECSSSGGFRQEQCTVRTPLINHDGTPVTETVYIMTKLEVPPRPTVAGVLGDWLKLHNGKFFNQVSQKFKNSAQGKEYSSEDEPKPELPKGAKVTQVKGSLLLLNNGYWLDENTGKTSLLQAPRVVGFSKGGWLELENGEFYKPETDEWWDRETQAPRRNPTWIPPSVPKGTIVEGFSNGWVKVKGGSWLNPDFAHTLPANTSTDELQRLGISTHDNDTESSDSADSDNDQDDYSNDERSGRSQQAAHDPEEETSPGFRDPEAEGDLTSSEEEDMSPDIRDPGSEEDLTRQDPEYESPDPNSIDLSLDRSRRQANHFEEETSPEPGGPEAEEDEEEEEDSRGSRFAETGMVTDEGFDHHSTPVDEADDRTMDEDRQRSSCGSSSKRGGGASAARSYANRFRVRR